MGRRFQRDAGEDLAELLAQAVVHDVVHHPHGRLGDAGGELIDLDAVELIDIDLGKGSGLQVQLARGI